MTLFLVAVGSTSHALLQRSMSFGVIQTAVLIGSLTSTTCAITAAALGAGAWALVLQQVVLAAVTSALLHTAGAVGPVARVLSSRHAVSVEVRLPVHRGIRFLPAPAGRGRALHRTLRRTRRAWDLESLMGDRLGAAVAARSADRARDLRRVRTTAREPGAGGGHVVEGSHPARRRWGSLRSSASSR